MDYIDVTFCGDGQVPLATAKVPDIEGGWWVVGARKDEHQSWERPFSVGLIASETRDCLGHTMFVDTGEAYSYFEQRPSQTPSMAPQPFLPMMPGMLPMPPMPPMPELRMPLPITGRPTRKFPGISEYLAEYAKTMLPPDGDASLREGSLRLLQRGIVGETEEAATGRETRNRNKLRLDLVPLSGRMINYVPNKVLNRTVMHTYEYETAGGTKALLFVGAQFQGHDLLWFKPQTGMTELPGDGYPFGQAQCGNAELYEVEWMVTRRFGGTCAVDDPYARQFQDFVVRMFQTTKFDDAICQERVRRERVFREAQAESHKKSIDELQQMNREMREDRRRKEAISDWEDARRRERQMESERRIRDGWSAVIRGVDRYAGPDGRIWEMPMRGPGYRAYYDRLSGDVIHTDGIPPVGWEELPRVQ